MYYILLEIGGVAIDSYKFKKLGGVVHKRALQKAQKTFCDLMGEDLLDEIANYLFLNERE